jgi:hypothetical protein
MIEEFWSGEIGWNCVGRPPNQHANSRRKKETSMIQNALFVLGAGASCPYGFPTGRGLREEVLSRYAADVENYLRHKSANDPLLTQEVHKARDFVNKFRESSTPSIDLFLARNPEFSMRGKRAIIFRILAAERASRFREETEDRKQDWYTWLFEQMTNKLVIKEDYSRFSENDVSFITFNYDRSLEHFLYNSLINSFVDIPTDRIIEQLSHIKICHVFGQVGPLEWQAQSDQIEYRVDVNGTGVDSLCRNIRIVYEQGENLELAEAQELIRKANSVFFLGFGYAEENLNALRIPEVLENVGRVECTALGLTLKEIAKVKTLFETKINGKSRRVNVRDKDCLSLLREVL